MTYNSSQSESIWCSCELWQSEKAEIAGGEVVGSISRLNSLSIWLSSYHIPSCSYSFTVLCLGAKVSMIFFWMEQKKEYHLSWDERQVNDDISKWINVRLMSSMKTCWKIRVNDIRVYNGSLSKCYKQNACTCVRCSEREYLEWSDPFDPKRQSI